VRKRKFKKKKYYRLNRNIQAEKVRVVNEEGKQIGVMALTEALLRAQNQELDLVEIAPKAKPPVCKIIDFKKFRYLEAKKGSAKKIKKSETKEVRLSPFIAENDLKTRLNRIKKFLKDKNQVKVTIVFKGRQIAKKEFGYQLVKQVTESLSDYSRVGQEPKFLGRRLIMILYPDEKTKKEKVQNKKVNPKEV